MNIKNTLISDLLKKDKTLSQQAAEAIINNKDIDAWKYLIENSDYIMDFIKNNASKKLLQSSATPFMMSSPGRSTPFSLQTVMQRPITVTFSITTSPLLPMKNSPNT